MPSKHETDAVFKNLVNNGLDFIERSGEELAENKPTFAIAHFAIGLELLLKARLFADHWTLASDKPHDYEWSSLIAGKVKTVEASKLCAAISNICGPLSRETETFREVFSHRNAVLHFVPPRDLAKVEMEQCRAWYYLHRLLTKTWSEEFELFATRVGNVERSLRRHRPYLQARFELLKDRLDGKSTGGLLERCSACDFNSAELEKTARQTIPFYCDVCGASGYFVEFECDNRLSVDDLPVECACGEEHTREELFALLDTRASLSGKEAWAEPDRAHCGECTAEVVEMTDGYFCIECTTLFELGNRAACEYCGTEWVGRSAESLEHSYLSGCGVCEGRYDRDD